MTIQSSEKFEVKAQCIKYRSGAEFYINDEQAVLYNEGYWGAI